MSNDNNESTLEVQGFTPYAQVPSWIIRSGDKLSHGAVRLYGVIMTYADNKTRAAFPGREKLAEDMGVKARSISTYIKELEEFGALKVTRRRNKRTGNYYANHYTLIFQYPCAENCTPPDAENDPVTTPTITNYTQPCYTSEQSSDDHVSRPIEDQTHVARAHSTSDARQHAQEHGYRAYSPKNPGNLTGDQRWMLIKKLQIVGLRLKDGHRFHDEVTQYAWDDFVGHLQEYATNENLLDELAHQIDCGKFTVGARVADKYEAGKKLNTMLNTSATI